MLRRTPFDELFLGMPCYRLVPPIESPDLLALAAARAKGAIFADAKIGASDLETAGRLLGLGFRRICTQVLLRVCLEGPLCAGGDARIGDRLDLGPADVRAHAAQLETGRIRQDPLIATEAAIAFYAAWVRNCTSGGKRVASIDHNFLTFEDAAGVRLIDLLSVMNRRAGIAKRLLLTIIEDARKEGLREVRVITDRDNSAACHAYAAAGFVPERSLAIFHLLSREGE
jgi:GNAT superfamily N-acetyltransferase